MLNLFKSFFGGTKKFEQLEDEEFQEALKSANKPVIIDVRSRNEFQQVKIPQAMNIDIMHPQFKKKLEAFDRQKPYFLYCQSGRRSARACKKMAKMGFENIHNLKGGILRYTGKTV